MNGMTRQVSGPIVNESRSRRIIFITAAVLLIVVPVIDTAEETTSHELKIRLGSCGAIADSLRRLSCFDTLVEEFIADSLPQPTTLGEGEEPGAVGNWLLEKTNNPLDDTQRVVARLQAVDGKGRLGGGGPVELYVRCQSGTIEVFLWWREFIGTAALGGGSINVTTRFDQEDAIVRKWLKSTDGQQTFVPAGAEGFALKLTVRSRLVASVTPIAANPVTAVFELAGAADAIAEVRSACSR